MLEPNSPSIRQRMEVNNNGDNLICDDGIERPDAIEIGELIEKRFREFLESGRLIGENGLAVGSGGNMSMRVPGGILITSSGSKLSELKQDEIVFVHAIEDNNIYFIGPKKHSSETIMHWMIYQKRPDIMAISHVNVGPKDCKNIVTSKDEIPWGTKELSQDTAEMLKYADVAMMKNHGVIAVGKDLKEATELIVEYADKEKAFIF